MKNLTKKTLILHSNYGKFHRRTYFILTTVKDTSNTFSHLILRVISIGLERLSDLPKTLLIRREVKIQNCIHLNTQNHAWRSHDEI